MSLIEQASIIITPNGVKEGKLYGLKGTDLDVVRATTATRVNAEGLIESVENNVPRLDYTNGSCPSILVEPQRTNLFPNSQTTLNWLFTNVSRTANNGISPDGTQNADLLFPTTSGAVFFNSTNTASSLVVGQPFICSFFIKLNTSFTSNVGANIIDLRLSAVAAWTRPTIRVNFETGEVTNILNASNISSRNYGNGWYRIKFGATPTGVSSVVSLQAPTGVTLDGGSFYIWGLQGELGSNATSYIPTVASAVTRNADVIVSKSVIPTIGGTLINSNFYQKYTGQTPSIIDLRSDFDSFVIIPEIVDVSNKTEAIFLTDIKANIPFSISIRGVGVIHWGDGSTTAYNSPNGNVTINKTFLKNSGIVAFVGTLTSLFSTTSNVNTSHRMEDLPSGLTIYNNGGSNTTSGDIANLPSGLTSYINFGQNTTSGDIANLPSGMTVYNNQGQNTTSGDIANIPSGLTTYINAGANTTSGDIANIPSGMTLYINTGQNTTSGDIANLPSGLTFYQNTGQNTTSGDIANIPSGMTVYNNQGQNTTSGDIANLPSGLTVYNNQGQNQVNQYTAGRVWANNMGLIDHRPAVGFGLTSTMVDNLLIDLSNVVNWVGSRRITLTGNNAPRTAASNAAVTTLQGRGVTVQTN